MRVRVRVRVCRVNRVQGLGALHRVHRVLGLGLRGNRQSDPNSRQDLAKKIVQQVAPAAAPTAALQAAGSFATKIPRRLLFNHKAGGWGVRYRRGRNNC